MLKLERAFGIILIVLISVWSLSFSCFSSEIDTIVVTFEDYGPSWDINNNGEGDYLDVSLLVTHYGETGPPGWIQSDMTGPSGDPDGVVDYLDVSYLIDHYGEEWLIT